MGGLNETVMEAEPLLSLPMGPVRTLGDNRVGWIPNCEDAAPPRCAHVCKATCCAFCAFWYFNSARASGGTCSTCCAFCACCLVCTCCTLCARSTRFQNLTCNTVGHKSAPPARKVQIVVPKEILFVGVHKYHRIAQVMVLDSGCRACMYLGYEGGTLWVQLMLVVAMEYYYVLLYNTVAPIGGSLRWAPSTCVENDADKGAMKAGHQARLEPPRNPGCASLDLCTCAAGCGMHMVRGNGQPTGGSNRHRDGASHCFAACVLLCSLVAGLHP